VIKAVKMACGENMPISRSKKDLKILCVCDIMIYILGTY